MKHWIGIIIFFAGMFNFSVSQAAVTAGPWAADKNATADKQKINDKMEAYFLSCLSAMAADEAIADSEKKIQVPVAVVREICSFKNDEKILGGTIDSRQNGNPLFLFTDCAFYVIKSDVYQGFMSVPQPASIAGDFEQGYQVLNYGQLKKMQKRNLPQSRQYQAGGTIFEVRADGPVAGCLDKMSSYLQSEAVIYRIAPAAPVKALSLPFLKGHTLLVFTDRQNDLPAIQQSLDSLVRTGADSVCLVTNGQMETFDSPQILPTSKDDITRSVIKIARQRKLKIILKPMIDPQDHVWRAWINFFDQDGRQDLARWQQWWNSYEQFILDNARMAQEAGAEMFCLGCEIGSTEQFETKWRHLIRQVRQVYHGLLTYNINHGPLDNVKWWDALDVVSVSAYYHLEKYVQQAGRQTEPNNPLYQIPLADMKAGFAVVRDELRQYAKKMNKPIFFIECGVCNAKGCAREPWTHASPSLVYDQDEQARYYTAMFETFFNEPWFAGFAWWAWPGLLYGQDQAKTDVGFCIYGKAAESVVKEWYGKPREDVTLEKTK